MFGKLNFYIDTAAGECPHCGESTLLIAVSIPGTIIVSFLFMKLFIYILTAQISVNNRQLEQECRT